MKNYKKGLYIFSILLFLGIIVFSNLFFSFKQTYASNNDAKLIVNVLDLHTKLPITNATICIVETNSYYYTDTSGYSEIIEIPITIINKQKNWQDFTILTYKNGYNDYLYCNCKLKPNQKKVGVTIFLSELTHDRQDDYIVFTEKPDDAWTKQIIKNYKK